MSKHLVGLRLILPAIQCGSVIGRSGAKVKEIRDVSRPIALLARTWVFLLNNECTKFFRRRRHHRHRHRHRRRHRRRRRHHRHHRRRRQYRYHHCHGGRRGNIKIFLACFEASYFLNKRSGLSCDYIA